MQRVLNVCVVLLVGLCTFAKDHKPAIAAPTQFEIGRMTFFDFGPPFDYYDLYIVRPAGSGSALERISLTPSAGCAVPARTEVAKAVLTQSVTELLQNKNPCSIPEKRLKKEQKRCKKCVVFSGATIAMQVTCGDSVRVIHSSVFDRDWFDPNAGTPEQTSWTMRLLSTLDRAAGATVMDKPMFAGLEPVEESDSNPHVGPSVAEDLEAGRYDALFGNSSHKVSDIFRESLNAPRRPTVKVSMAPYEPDNIILPKYPPIARAANVSGQVHLVISVDDAGLVSRVTVESGHPMLREAAKEAASQWKFPNSARSQFVNATMDFETNCER